MNDITESTIDKRVEMHVRTAFGPLDLQNALQHAVNYHGIDAKVSMPDWKLAELLVGEVEKHLRGQTDVQIFERMTPEERSKIGKDGDC